MEACVGVMGFVLALLLGFWVVREFRRAMYDIVEVWNKFIEDLSDEHAELELGLRLNEELTAERFRRIQDKLISIEARVGNADEVGTSE